MSARHPLDWVEIEVDRCALTYSEAPCAAQLGVTGDHPCFHGWATCQDPENIDLAPHWVRFAEATAELPRLHVFAEPGMPHWLPLLVDVRHSPVRPDPGRSIGVRAELRLTLQDAPYHDAGIDKHWHERGFDPATRSTLWLKLLTRFPHYVGRRLRWHRGRIEAGAFVEEAVREYVIERVEGPDPGGRVTITAKDPLKLADRDRAQAPRPSQARLVDDLAEEADPTFIDVDAPFPADFPNDDGIIFVGREGMQYGSLSFNADGTMRLSGLVRGLPDGYETERRSHAAGDAVQAALYYKDVRLVDIVQDLLVNHVPGFDPAWIPFAEWEEEHDRWFAGQTLRRLIAEPEGVQDLINEIVGQTLTWGFWWDEEGRVVRYRAIRPPDVDEPVPALSDENHLIAGSVARVDEPERVANEVQIVFGQRDPTGRRDERTNYRRVSARIDADSQSARELGQRRVRRVFARWHPDGNAAAVAQYTARALAAAAAKTFRIEFALTRADGEGLKMASFADLTTLWIIDELGLPRTTRVQLLRAEADGDEMSFQARRDVFSAQRVFGRFAPGHLAGLTYAAASEDQRARYLFWADESGEMSDGSEGYRWL